MFNLFPTSEYQIARRQKNENRFPETNLSLRTDLIIPKIEIEAATTPNKDKLQQSTENENEKNNSYVSLSEVDHSKISSQVVTPACTPINEHPFDQGSPFTPKNAQSGCKE